MIVLHHISLISGRLKKRSTQHCLFLDPQPRLAPNPTTMPSKRPPPKLQKARINHLCSDNNPLQAPSGASKDIIERIKKCWDRARHDNANEAEANAAIRMAAKIMEQHQISEAEVMADETQEQLSKRGGQSSVNIWPAREDDEYCRAQNQVWVTWLVSAMRTFFDCNAYSTAYDREIMWTFYGIAEYTASAAISFETVHNLIQDWARKYKGVSTRNSYSLGIADGLVRILEEEKEAAEETARRFEARALAARIREEDMKQQIQLERLRNPPAEPTPELESDDEEMDFGDTDGADNTDGFDNASDDEALPDFTNKHDGEAAAVDAGADFDSELRKFVAPEPSTSINKPEPASRTQVVEEYSILPSTEGEEEAEPAIEPEETAEWKSMRQLSTFRAMSKDIEESVLKEHKVKLRKGRKTKRSVKDREAFSKGKKDSQEIDVKAARIEQGNGEDAVIPSTEDDSMEIDGQPESRGSTDFDG